MELTSRERVHKVLNFEEPDRVPICIGSSGASVNDIVYYQLKEHFKIEGDVEPFRSGHGDNIYDPRVFDKLGGDFRHVFLKSNLDFKAQKNEDGSYVNEWGVTVKKVGMFNEWIDNPLKGAEISDLNTYNWPKPSQGNRDRDLKADVEHWYNDTDFAISTRSPSRGFWDLGIQLRGFEDFVMDMVINKKFVHKMMGKILDVLLGFYDELLSTAGPYVQIVETQDDLGFQTAPFISPQMYDEFMLPYRIELNKFIKSKAPNAKIYQHCCGSIRKIIPNMIEAGIEVFNPIQPLATGMNTAQLKKDFGKDIVFFGGIDLQERLAGPPEIVEMEVKERIRDLAPGGGFILAPANVVQPDVPVSNLILMCDLARKYGKYPINIDL
ncbi:uroporphyrinogen decarboxylase family protein [Clostridium sediminicola]|uniref:uroporphyrinogen decarboxylase family protein n=1 Tax=Clostridium sediminicola TaxID=3114879 RepID=UPI0031F272C2